MTLDFFSDWMVGTCQVSRVPQEPKVASDLPMGGILGLFPGKSTEDHARLQQMARRVCPLPWSVEYWVEDGQLVARMPNELRGEANESLGHWQEVESRGGTRNDPAGIFPLLQRILEINPYHAETRIGLAFGLSARDEIDGALEVMVEWIRLDPDNADAFVLIPMMLPESHRNDETMRRYVAKGLEIDANHPGLLYLSGQLELNSDHPEAAYSLFQRSLKVSEGFVQAIHGKACACVHMDRLEEAAEGLESMFRILHGRTTLADENLEMAVEQYLELCMALSERHEKSFMELAWREQHRMEREFGWEIRWCGIKEDEQSASRQSEIRRVSGKSGLRVEIDGTTGELESGLYRMLQLVTLRWMARSDCELGEEFSRHASRWVRRCGPILVEPSEGEDADGKRDGVSSAIEGYLRLLLSSPVEWLLVRDIMEENPSFRWKILPWLEGQARTLQILIENKESMKEFHPKTRNALLVLVGARAFFLNEITRGAIDFTQFHRGHATGSASERLLRRWNRRTRPDRPPADPYALIDDAARIAGIAG